MFSRHLLKPQWHSYDRYLALPIYFTRSFAIRREPPSFPTIPKCPSPTCSCSETPELPPNLSIDHKANLNGTMAPYVEHVLICTGKDDWESKIVDENSRNNLAAQFDQLLGRGGLYADPYHNLSVLNSSFPSSASSGKDTNTSAYLLPSFKYVPFIHRNEDVNTLVKGYLLPEKLHPAHSALSDLIKKRLTKDGTVLNELRGGLHDINDILVLICGHGGRDARCGRYGPALRDEFEKSLETYNIKVSKDVVDPSSFTDENKDKVRLDNEEDDHEVRQIARVGLISHIGGHKFAGNTIIYLPPKLKIKGVPHPFAGCGIWYARVEPKHVDGILKETIIGGKVIEELFRGGIRQDRGIMRL